MSPRDLMETAHRLAAPSALQPTQVDLRRAVSTAYYALFHCLAATAADLLTESSRGNPEWHQVYRALEHGRARNACQQQGVMQTFPTAVRLFGDTLIDLQKARQQADYAHDGEYTRRDVMDVIVTVEHVISEFEQADIRHRRSFAVHVLFKRRQA